MNPLLDQLLVGTVVAAALGWLLLRTLRRKSDKACGSDCGCGAKKAGE